MNRDIPLFLNKSVDLKVHFQESVNDTIVYIMGYDRLTFQTPVHKNFQLFEDHLKSLNDLHYFSLPKSLYVYLNWDDDNLQIRDFQDSTLIESKSFLKETSTSMTIKKEKQSSFTMKNPKQPALLGMFNYDKNLKRRFVPLEKLFKSFNKCSNLSFLRFESIIRTVGFVLWTNLTSYWLRWLDKQVKREWKLEKGTFQSLACLFKDLFFQNYFIIKDSRQYSVDDFCSAIEYNLFNKNKIKKYNETFSINVTSSYFKILGIWIDMRNGILIFANSNIKENLSTCGEPTTIVAGYCINNIAPELLTKKIVLFINISLIEFFKTQVN